MRLISAAGLPVSRWVNGAGRKADIAAGEGWMVGYAWLDADAPFSDLAGLDRTITLVEGPGFTLEIAGRAPLVIDQPFVPAAFDGGARTTCRVRGLCRVLNVMTARERVRHTVTIGGEVADAASFAIVLRGAATVAGARLERLDAVQQPSAPITGTGPDTLFATVTLADIDPSGKTSP